MFSNITEEWWPGDDSSNTSGPQYFFFATFQPVLIPLMIVLDTDA